MLKVWGRATSSNVQKVMWAAAELGLDVERVDVGGPYGGLDTPQYRAMNPHGKIPTVETDDGLTMWESNAVVRHLALSDPERRLWPKGGQAEVSADMWMEWATMDVARAVNQLFWSIIRPSATNSTPEVLAQRTDEAIATMRVADATLAEREHLAGSSLTIADIAIGPVLYRYQTLPFERPPLAALDAYYERLQARPAYVEHAMVDYSSLRPR